MKKEDHYLRCSREACNRPIIEKPKTRKDNGKAYCSQKCLMMEVCKDKKAGKDTSKPVDVYINTKTGQVVDISTWNKRGKDGRIGKGNQLNKLRNKAVYKKKGIKGAFQKAATQQEIANRIRTIIMTSPDEKLVWDVLKTWVQYDEGLPIKTNVNVNDDAEVSRDELPERIRELLEQVK